MILAFCNGVLSTNLARSSVASATSVTTGPQGASTLLADLYCHAAADILQRTDFETVILVKAGQMDSLADLGLNASGIRTQFQLSAAAKPETLQVFVDDEEVPEDPQRGWTYDPETWFVRFNKDAVPPRGSTISARYTIQPGVPSPPAGS